MDMEKEDLKAILNILLRNTVIVLLVLGRIKANIWMDIIIPLIADNNTDS